MMVLDSRDALIVHLASFAKGLHKHHLRDVVLPHLKKLKRVRKSDADDEHDPSVETHRQAFERLFPSCAKNTPSKQDLSFAELSPERCAAVFSAHRRIVWCTESMKLAGRIERNRSLDPGSVLWRVGGQGTVDERERCVPATAWFPTSVDVEIVEHAVASHEFRIGAVDVVGPSGCGPHRRLAMSDRFSTPAGP